MINLPFFIPSINLSLPIYLPEFLHIYHILLVSTSLFFHISLSISLGSYLSIFISINLSFFISILIALYCTFFNRDIGPAVRVFANGPGDLGSIPGRVIPKTLKMELDTTLLNTQHYKVRFKGKVEQSWEWSSALPYTLV